MPNSLMRDVRVACPQNRCDYRERERHGNKVARQRVDYSRRGARVDYLSRKFASDDNRAGHEVYRRDAEALVEADVHEVGEKHGQRVRKIFHNADFIVSLDVPRSVKEQVDRFCELLFGSNSISPNHQEYGLFLTKAAALRTLDLSRQVGAAFFPQLGNC
jgi:hypothetical protein